MLGSRVEIYNSALAKLGVEGVSSPSDSNTRARLCTQLYDICRRDVLRAHPWNFAKKEAALNDTGNSPVLSTFTKIYQLPADFLRALDVQDNYIPWKVYGDKIYTSASSVKLLYIYNCEHVGLFDANFVEALAYRMAKDLAKPLTDSTTTAQEMDKQYKWQLSQARSFNAQEGTNDQVSAEDWLNSRY